jgi:hypothetical protein
MDIREWSVSDVLSTEILGSLNITAVIIINYCKWTQSYKIENKRIREEKLFDQLKSTKQYYYNLFRPTN